MKNLPSFSFVPRRSAPGISRGDSLRLTRSAAALFPAVDVRDDVLAVPFKLEHVEAGVGAVDDVDAPAGVCGDVVRLNDLPTHVRVALVGPAPEIGVPGHGGNVEGDVGRVVGVADVESAHARIEVRDELEFLVKGDPNSSLVACGPKRRPC